MTGYEYLVDAISAVTDECIVWERGTWSCGYGNVWVDGRARYAHMIALDLHTPRPAGKVCSIKNEWVDGDKLEAAHGPCHEPACFNPLHLSWRTRAENEADKKRDGTHNDNEANGRCELSDVDVDRIRKLYKGPQHWRRPKTGPTLLELAKEFGCGQTQIARIVNGHSRSAA